MKRLAGFTLIELLIVMFIISIVTSVALLTISHNENHQMESFTHEITQLLTLAQEQAILEPTVLGLVLTGHSYQFASLEGNTISKNNSWNLLNDTLLGIHTIPDNLQLEMKIGNAAIAANNDTNTINPQIVISTNGDMTPFTLYIGKKAKKPRYAITGDANGNITYQLLS